VRVSSEPAGVRDAVILAAGNGDRFQDPNHRSKLLHPVLGQPLILRTLQSAAEAGITSLHVVIGYDAERLRSLIESSRIPGVSVDFVHNADWQLENGVSALCAEALCAEGRFALLMGDHLFDPAVLKRLCTYRVGPGESVLAVDKRPADPVLVDEATRVRLHDDRIVAIGKGLTPWDALDTGMFVFTPALYAALRDARAAGETTLSAGVQRLAARGVMRAAAVVDSSWCDIDTSDDLGIAEALFAPAGAGRA
jgi:1L-myo-inositol 1-phosphate cytidylyltransferase